MYFNRSIFSHKLWNFRRPINRVYGIDGRAFMCNVSLGFSWRTTIIRIRKYLVSNHILLSYRLWCKALTLFNYFSVITQISIIKQKHKIKTSCDLHSEQYSICVQNVLEK